MTFGLAYGAAVRGAHLIRGRRDGGSALRGHPRDSHRTMLPAATTHLQRQPETRTFPGSKASRRRPGARKPRRRIGLDDSGSFSGFTKRPGEQSTCTPQRPFQVRPHCASVARRQRPSRGLSAGPRPSARLHSGLRSGAVQDACRTAQPTAAYR